jgi:hypothetical protein
VPRPNGGEKEALVERRQQVELDTLVNLVNTDDDLLSLSSLFCFFFSYRGSQRSTLTWCAYAFTVHDRVVDD